MAIFRYRKDKTKMDVEDVRKRIKTLKEILKRGECERAYRVIVILFRYMTVAQALATDVCEDILEIAREYEKRCQR